MLDRLRTATPNQARRRALAKTVGYRFLMVLVTITVAWLVVGDVRAALDIGIAANVVKTGTYYAYERLWDRVEWGMTPAEGQSPSMKPGD